MSIFQRGRYPLALNQIAAAKWRHVIYVRRVHYSIVVVSAAGSRRGGIKTVFLISIKYSGRYSAVFGIGFLIVVLLRFVLCSGRLLVVFRPLKGPLHFRYRLQAVVCWNLTLSRI